MDSLHNLALQGHFEKLREEAKSLGLTHGDTSKDLIVRVIQYLETGQKEGQMDKVGKALLQDLKSEILTLSIDLPARKPMKKARSRKNHTDTGKKAIQ